MSEIIARHGSLVMGVCRGVLRNEHDAADAFQATFLVLLKKASSLGHLTSLAGWLHGVAHRVANKSRSQSSWRQKREGTGIEMNPTAPPFVPADEETVSLIHQELCQLPERFRLPLILCCLEGEGREEAAEHLGWTLGSLKGRLERAREMLHQRLKRRGVVLSTAAITGLLTQQAVAEVPVALASSTVQALTLAASGQALISGIVSTQTAALTQGVLKAMFITKLKISGMILLAGGVAATGSAVVMQRALATPGGDKAVQVAAGPKPTTPKVPNTEIAQNDKAETAPTATAPKGGEDQQIDKEKDAHKKLRQQGMQNLRHLGLAMHNYASGQGSLPAAALYGKGNKPLLSWRVMLLPYLDQDKLYRQFKLDEPWDSPHNKTLLSKMPEIFAAPGLRDKFPDQTFYQVFTGKGTPFDGTEGMRFDKVTDGLSKTILIVEAGTPVPWTKPADIVYDTEKPLPKLGGIFKEGFGLCIGDGSARFLGKDIAEADLRPWITPAAGDTASDF